MEVKNVYLPWWDGSLTKNGWRTFFAMRNEIDRQDCNYIRIKNYPINITCSQETHLCIQPNKTRKKYHDASYPGINIMGKVHDREIALEH